MDRSYLSYWTFAVLHASRRARGLHNTHTLSIPDLPILQEPSFGFEPVRIRNPALILAIKSFGCLQIRVRAMYKSRRHKSLRVCVTFSVPQASSASHVSISSFRMYWIAKHITAGPSLAKLNVAGARNRCLRSHLCDDEERWTSAKARPCKVGRATR